jgi:hypothetical protein
MVWDEAQRKKGKRDRGEGEVRLFCIQLWSGTVNRPGAPGMRLGMSRTLSYLPHTGRTYLVDIFSDEIPTGYFRERIAYMPIVLISDGRRIIPAGLPLSLSSLCVAEEALFVLASKG